MARRPFPRPVPTEDERNGLPSTSVDNRARVTGLETRIECGFCSSMRYQLLLRTIKSESCRFGHTPVQDRSNDTKGKLQNGFCAAPEVQQYTGTVVARY